jgi:sulfur carrier protein
MFVNGEELELKGEISLNEFLGDKGYDLERVAVEKNGSIVAKKCFGTEKLTDSDKLEIVAFVGGG